MMDEKEKWTSADEADLQALLDRRRRCANADVSAAITTLRDLVHSGNGLQVWYEMAKIAHGFATDAGSVVVQYFADMCGMREDQYGVERQAFILSLALRVLFWDGAKRGGYDPIKPLFDLLKLKEQGVAPHEILVRRKVGPELVADPAERSLATVAMADADVAAFNAELDRRVCHYLTNEFGVKDE